MTDLERLKEMRAEMEYMFIQKHRNAFTSDNIWPLIGCEHPNCRNMSDVLLKLAVVIAAWEN